MIDKAINIDATVSVTMSKTVNLQTEGLLEKIDYDDAGHPYPTYSIDPDADVDQDFESQYYTPGELLLYFQGILTELLENNGKINMKKWGENHLDMLRDNCKNWNTDEMEVVE
jgi:hypothetical protein